MRDVVFIYHTPTEDVTFLGFIAYLLHMGEAWDVRCLQADIQDYHAQQYTRVHPTIALRQELEWWCDFVEDASLCHLPLCEELGQAGLHYLRWCVNQQILPLSDSEKLNTEMTIRIDEHHVLIKFGADLGIYDRRTEEPPLVIHGFPAQLLTYAACTTMDAYIRQTYIDDPWAWVDCMIGWLQSPSCIWLRHIRFDIPDVYLLYDSFLSDAKTQWDANNRRCYHAGKPQQRYFMTQLYEQLQAESQEAIRNLADYLSAKQHAQFVRYLSECQLYIHDRIKTKRKERSDELCQYYNISVVGRSRHFVTRHLHEAATHPTSPAAELAKVVKKMIAQKVLIADIRPHTHFIAVINKAFGTKINHDSFSKHFRR